MQSKASFNSERFRDKVIKKIIVGTVTVAALPILMIATGVIYFNCERR